MESTQFLKSSFAFNKLRFVYLILHLRCILNRVVELVKQSLSVTPLTINNNNNYHHHHHHHHL